MRDKKIQIYVSTLSGFSSSLKLAAQSVRAGQKCLGLEPADVIENIAKAIDGTIDTNLNAEKKS